MKNVLLLLMICLLVCGTALADDTLTVDGLRMILPEGCTVRGIGQGVPDEDGDVELLTIRRDAPFLQIKLTRCQGYPDLAVTQSNLRAKGIPVVEILEANGQNVLIIAQKLAGYEGLSLFEAVVMEGNKSYLMVQLIVPEDLEGTLTALQFVNDLQTP